MKKAIVIVLVLGLGLAAQVASADFTFGEPTNLGPTVNSSAHDYDPSMSADELEFYLVSGGYSSRDLWVATRASVSDPWAAPVKLGPTVNTAYNECCPDISADGLSLFFWSNRPGGSGGQDLWVTTRASTSDPWTEAVNLGPTVNSSSWDGGPSISPDGLSLFFFSGRPGGSGGFDLWVTTRTTVSDPWAEPVNLGPTVNSPADDATPDISADGLALFFFSTRSGGYGNYDLWVTTRTTLSNPWGSPVNLGPTLNTSTFDFSPNISADGSTLYFNSGRSGGLGGDDIWQVTISPVVDFNADGAVDAGDMSVMVHYWGQNEPLCDIGPMPWGDGVVDVEDLVVLAKHVGPGLEAVAHWKLDEGARPIAHDSIGGSDATVMGGATWRPEDGLIDGALELDGVDDHVATDFTADPKAGPVRVVCWVKTDVPGSVIVSQTSGTGFGSTWLATDPADGTLMTEMMFPLPPLQSTAVVADGQWHEVTAEWDGTYRRLWVDHHEVVKDALPVALPPLSWNGTFTFGAGANLEPGTFFSGLIDDVRIYNRAVRP